MTKAVDMQDFVNTFNAGHPGSIYSPNQAGLPEAFERFRRESRKINTGDVTHQVIIGKSRDGMSGFAKSIPSKSHASRTTGLLTGLLRRI